MTYFINMLRHIFGYKSFFTTAKPMVVQSVSQLACLTYIVCKELSRKKMFVFFMKMLQYYQPSFRTYRDVGRGRGYTQFTILCMLYVCGLLVKIYTKYLYTHTKAYGVVYSTNRVRYVRILWYPNVGVQNILTYVDDKER